MARVEAPYHVFSYTVKICFYRYPYKITPNEKWSYNSQEIQHPHGYWEALQTRAGLLCDFLSASHFQSKEYLRTVRHGNITSLVFDKQKDDPHIV